MNNPLRTADDYELFIYEIKERFPSVRRSTLAFVRRGSSLARVAGELHFDKDVRLVVHPDMKHHRILAPLMTFSSPNLPELIREITEGL